MNRAKWESLQIRIESFNLENGLAGTVIAIQSRFLRMRVGVMKIKRRVLNAEQRSRLIVKCSSETLAARGSIYQVGSSNIFTFRVRQQEEA